MVSAWDTYLSIRFQDMLRERELNPIGCWLIDLDGGDVAIFMGVKFAGTVLVLGVLAFTYMHCRKFSWGLMVPLFIFQALLLAFLEGWIF